MAMPQRAIELNEKRLELINEIERLKVEARTVKKEMDDVIVRANLAHKLGGLSDQDKAHLKSLLAD
jgi:hypothetical protein